MAGIEYARRAVRKLLAEPGDAGTLVRRELNYFGRRLDQRYFAFVGPPEDYALADRDWDTAVILDDAWSKTGTHSPPDRVTEAAITAHEEFPNKRLLVHYMQPHLPIVAEGHRWITDELVWFRGLRLGADVTREEFQAAYRANLEHVIDHVEALLEAVPGRTVVTSDHGEMLGERLSPVPVRMYAHKPSLYVPELVEVPWIVVEDGERREIRDEPPAEPLDVDEDARRERLQFLGYMG